MIRWPGRGRLLGVASLALVAASACGSSASPEEHKRAADVLADARTALTASKSVHVQGTLTSGADTESLDLQLQPDAAAGTLTTGGVAVKIINTGGSIYLNAPAAFWTKTAGTKAAALGGKWITVSAAQAGGAGNLTLNGISTSLNSSDSPLNPTTTVGTASGQKAIVLTQHDGSQLFVADSTSPRPLKLVNHGNQSGSLTFSDYGKTQTISAPAGALSPQQALGSSGA